MKERAQGRWNAIVAGDLKKAYDYVSPAGRSVVTLEEFRSGIKQGFHKAARVEEVKCESADACDVRVELAYEYSGSRLNTAHQEKWVRQDGSWWYLLR